MRLPGSLIKWSCALLLAVATSAALAQVRTTLPFRTLDPVLPPLTGLLGATPAGKIEVIQFFYYGCPHCFDQQPLIDDWLLRKPEDVEFRYVPALRDEKWVPLTKAWFTLEKLGEAMRLHRPIYDVINFDGVALSDEPKLIDWVVRNGVERNRFLEVYNSDEVKAKLEEARRLTTAYGIRATPTLVVGGRFAVSSGVAGSHYEAIRLLNQFVAQVRAGAK
jgi:thiol:disulfide interchange protein DsbA